MLPDTTLSALREIAGAEHVLGAPTADAILRASLALGGQLSGEHGIGLTKNHLLRTAVGDDAIDLMRGLKRLVDPFNILNPREIFAAQSTPTPRGSLADQPITG